MSEREPMPAGRVSHNANPAQIRSLKWVIGVLIVLALLGTIVPGTPGDVLATAAIVLLIATPLLRVAWLVKGWAAEGDSRFALIGAALLVVAFSGAILSLLGVGR